MTRADSVPVAYLAAQVRRVSADGDVALRDALRTADRLRDAAARITGRAAVVPHSFRRCARTPLDRGSPVC
jgi:hypothetical protein